MSDPKVGDIYTWNREVIREKYHYLILQRVEGIQNLAFTNYFRALCYETGNNVMLGISVGDGWERVA